MGPSQPSAEAPGQNADMKGSSIFTAQAPGRLGEFHLGRLVLSSSSITIQQRLS